MNSAVFVLIAATVAVQFIDVHGACKDLRRSCSHWKGQGGCLDKEDRVYMEKNCAKTCGYCSDGTESTEAPTEVPTGGPTYAPDCHDKSGFIRDPTYTLQYYYCNEGTHKEKERLCSHSWFRGHCNKMCGICTSACASSQQCASGKVCRNGQCIAVDSLPSSKMAAGTFCTDIKLEIKNEKDCKDAATSLGFTWAMSWNGPNDSPACFFDSLNGGKVFFNLSPNPDRASMLARRSPICKIDVCEDLNTQCDGRKRYGWCTTDKFTKENCRKTCGICKDSPDTTTSSSSATEADPYLKRTCTKNQYCSSYGAQIKKSIDGVAKDCLDDSRCKAFYYVNSFGRLCSTTNTVSIKNPAYQFCQNIVCEDTNNGLTDKDYNGCNWYRANKSGCGDYDVNGGFVSNQMCCACGGGKTSGNSEVGTEWENRKKGTFCTDIKFELTNENDCKEAATSLGFTWAMSWNGPNDSPACFFDSLNGGKVFFNLSPNPDRASMMARRSPICKIDGCDPYSEKTCRDVANSLGLMLGGDKGRFAGDGVKMGVFGCFALVGYGSRKGDAYYGRGGTIDQMKSGFSGYQKNLRYRPIGYDCIEPCEDEAQMCSFTKSMGLCGTRRTTQCRKTCNLCGA